MNRTSALPLPSVVAADADALAHAAAQWLVERLERNPGRQAIALSGGSTPLALYTLLATSRWADTMAWQRLHVFWGDERMVAHEHADSNAGAACRAWLAHVPIPAGNIHPIPTADGAEAAARAYAAMLQDFHGSTTLDPARPLFDVVLLGLGEDGHTASLFPGDAALDETRRWTRAVSRPDVDRVTLTLPVLGSAAAVAYLASGAGKRTMAARLLAGDHELPAARVATAGERICFLDQAAAEASR